MEETSYAFLLRCWQEPDRDEKPAWRFSLIHINHKQDRKGFASLEELMIYLYQTLKAFETTRKGEQP